MILIWLLEGIWTEHKVVRSVKFMSLISYRGVKYYDRSNS
jgi:hypothetical protein